MASANTTAITTRQRKSGRIFFGWYIVAAGTMIQAFGYGSRYSFSVFFPTLLDEFGWPRDLGASILSTHLLFYGLTAPLAGGMAAALAASAAPPSATWSSCASWVPCVPSDRW